MSTTLQEPAVAAQAPAMSTYPDLYGFRFVEAARAALLALEQERYALAAILGRFPIAADAEALRARIRAQAEPRLKGLDDTSREAVDLLIEAVVAAAPKARDAFEQKKRQLEAEAWELKRREREQAEQEEDRRWRAVEAERARFEAWKARQPAAQEPALVH